MKPVEFKQVNVRIAENQPEYVTLPAHIANDSDRTVTSCFKLSLKELKRINETRKFWHQQWIGNNPMQPILMMVDNPFVDEIPVMPPIALEMIAEQYEILEKDNGYTLEKLKKLTNGQLPNAASNCLVEGKPIDSKYNKIYSDGRLKELSKAGAYIIAEMERLMMADAENGQEKG